jgi:predicted permease
VSWLHRIGFRLQALFQKKRIEADLSADIQAHLAMRTEANLAAGMSPEEARCAAQREFGGVDQAKERYHDERGVRWLEDGLRDVRHAVRSLLRDQGFAVTVLLILALCLAANVVIFSLVHGVLLRPLPFRDPGRIVTVFNSYPKAGIPNAGVSVFHYLERKREVAAFADAGLIRYEADTINTGGAPDRVDAAIATPSFFQVLGVAAALGRTFTEDEGVTGKNQVVLLSDGFWRQHFNADPSVIGRTLRLANTPYTIIGVMPPDFRYLSYDTRFWTPATFSEDDRRNRHGGGLEMIARLRPGATVVEAQAQIDALNERTLMSDPFAKEVLSVGFHATVRDLHSDHVAELGPVLLLLQAGVLCLLLVGTVNLANLFMVRATGRAREYSVRQVLGAGQWRLVRMLLCESWLLALTGGLLGIGLGAAALRSLATLAGPALPRDVAPRLDVTVGFAALGLSVILGLLLALPVIWLTLRSSLAAALTAESRGGTTSRPVHRLRHTLIIAQIALAFVLLSGAGLLGLSFTRLVAVQPGFHSENLLTGAVALPLDEYQEPKQRVAFISRLLTAVRTLPGISSAAICQGVPFSNRVHAIAWEIAGQTAASDEFIQEGMFTNHVSGGYFATLGVPLREGRVLADDDVQLRRKVCVVDEEFARRSWPRGDALGHRLVLPIDPQEPERQYVTIVGVVGSVKQDDLADLGVHGAVYFPIAVPSEFPVPSEFMVTVRTLQAPEAAGPALREAIWSIDPELPVTDVKTMETRIRDSVSGRRTPFLLAGIFAGMALVLAAVGIYGVLAYSVAQRRREIGVRMALGAQPEQILRQFLGLGIQFLGIGVPLGLIGAWLVGRAMAALLFGIGPANPLVLGGTAIMLAAVALLACVLPARRAAQVSPIEALRSD